MGWRLPHQLSSQHVVTWALQARVRFQALPARRRHTTMAAALVGLLLLLAWGAQQARQREQLERQRQAALAVPITTVTALGRLEPESRVINLAPPAGSVQLAQGRLKSLLVEEGDQVRQGQLLATMDSLPRLSRAVDEAAAQVAIAETQLRVASASLRSDLQTQRAKVRRAEANLRTEAAEEQRYRDLFRNGATSASVYEGQRL